MSRLGKAVPLMPGEVPQSFVSRLARGYGMDAASFCSDMGLSLQKVVDGCRDTLSAMARLAGLQQDDLGQYAFLRNGEEWTLRGQKLDREAVRRARLHVCPACIRDDVSASSLTPSTAAFIRAIWMLMSVRTCPIHGIGLVQVDGVRSKGVHDLADRVGGVLHRLDDLVAAAPIREASDYERYLIHRIEHGTSGTTWLDSLDFHVAAMTCEVVGAVATFGREPAVRDFDEGDWHKAGAAGHEIASRGVGSVKEFLSGLQRTLPVSPTGRDGAQIMFGYLYKWLAYSAPSARYDPVRALLRTHIVETMAVDPGTDVLGVIVERRRLHSIRSASLESGRHPKPLRRLLAAAGVIGADHVARLDSQVTFDADAAARVLAEASTEVTFPEMQIYINAPRVHARMIVREGFVSHFAPPAGRGGGVAVSTHELDRFMSALLADAQHEATVGGSIQNIIGTVKRANRGAADIIRLLLNHKLSWVGRRSGVDGYLSVLIDVDEVRQLLRGPEVDGLPEYKVAKVLQVNGDAVTALVELGALPTETVVNPVNKCPTRVVRTADLDAFRAAHVTLFQLAKIRGVHFRALKATLDAAGVLPSFGRPAVPCTFYRRSDLPA